jgi:ketopantoate hydroxymethyltransferase
MSRQYLIVQTNTPVYLLVQGRDQHSAERILADAKALENWGVQTIVIECIPAKLGKQISQSLAIPTITGCPNLNI